MPRALTEEEKCRQCDRLLEKGKDVVFTHGIKKVSVDDITKAAGMAKGLFYHHFQSKEEYLLKLIWYVHEHFFSQAEQMIINKNDLQADTRRFLTNLFNMPELSFFIKNHHDINALMDYLPKDEVQATEQKEVTMYEKMLVLAGIDTERIKPGVVHNYLHTLYMMMSSDLMVKKDLQETFDSMIDGLVAYIFGGGV
jgi:AcrR family transcriptional regulator